jgi:aspartate-semialdehyde dehydrogenase
VASGFNVAVVGATGAVGNEFLRLFEERNFPIAGLKLLASERSVGKTAIYKGETFVVEEAKPESFKGIDFAFFSAGASRSRALVPAAIEAGAYVIDNSSAFRMDPDVPLVVPNCTAIILLVAVNPLRDLGKIERLVVSTYQSASGGGAKVMDELIEETADAVYDIKGEEEKKGSRDKVLPHPYAFNLFSHNTPINEHGYNEEEWKVIQESRKILEMPDLRINVTCVRVPVIRAHSESITVEFAGEAPSEQQIREILASAPGVKLVDDRETNTFPMPITASGQGDVLVGRIRKDVSHSSAISMFVAGDQLLKGAALNAVQIAELLINIGQPVGASQYA